MFQYISTVIIAHIYLPLHVFDAFRVCAYIHKSVNKCLVVKDGLIHKNFPLLMNIR